MTAEPITIYSRKIDTRGVVQLLRNLAPELRLVGPEDSWEKVTIGGPKRFLRKSSTLTFLNNPDYYDGADWPRQVFGMQNYFSQFPGIGERREILRLIGSFRFALATAFDPEQALDGEDDRLTYIFAVAKHLDGVIFTPFALRDASGKILIAADGEYDPSAVMPHVPAEPAAQAQPRVEDEEVREPDPPTAQRVARRALALAAVCARGLVELEDASDPMVEVHRKKVLDWIDALAIGDELEPDEWKALQRPVGTLDRQAAVNATWRVEGLAVLAWALQRFELPAYDQMVDPSVLLNFVGFLDRTSSTRVVDKRDSPLDRRVANVQHRSSRDTLAVAGFHSSSGADGLS
jgi:hypothetical protein